MDGIVERSVFSSSILRHSLLAAFDWTLTTATWSDKLKVTTVVVLYRTSKERKRGNQGAFFFFYSPTHSLFSLSRQPFFLTRCFEAGSLLPSFFFYLSLCE